MVEVVDSTFAVVVAVVVDSTFVVVVVAGSTFVAVVVGSTFVVVGMVAGMVVDMVVGSIFAVVVRSIVVVVVERSRGAHGEVYGRKSTTSTKAMTTHTFFKQSLN